MKIFILGTFIILFTAPGFAASLQDGLYACNDNSLLELQRKDFMTYQASLTYSDDSVSTLELIKFRSTDSMVATMLPDDEGSIGHARVIRNGIVLNFDNGDKVTCQKVN